MSINPNIAVTNTEAINSSTQTQATQSNPYEARDIVAQETMADAAVWMMIAALGTLIVTTIGTIFLAKQVKLTRKAVEDTANATKAMEHQNEISERTAQRQLRSYVTFHSVLWEFPELMADPYTLQVLWENTGTTPAIALRTVIAVQVFENEAELKLPDLTHKIVGPLPVGPGQKFWSQTIPFDQPAYNKTADGKQRNAILGRALYEDIFGVAQETAFCVEIKISGPPPKMAFLPFTDNNFMRTR